MKSRIHYLIFTVVLFLVVTSAWLINDNQQIPQNSVWKGEAPASVGTPEDPDARAQYEWMRLRDPATDQIPLGIRKKELEYAETLPSRENSDHLNLQKPGRAVEVQNLDWSRRGPYNVGGRTRALAIDVTNENVINAAGVSGGMWRSIDGGQSWTKTTLPGELHSVTCLIQDTRAGKTNTWYYGAGEYRGSAASHWGVFFNGNGIFKSTDGGITWAQLPSTSSETPHIFDNPFDHIWSLAVGSSDSLLDVIYAATSGTIQRSTDGGNSWQRVLGEFPNRWSKYTDVAVTSNGVVYAALSEDNFSDEDPPDQGIWRSTDGINWTNITPAGWPKVYRRIVIGIALANENIVYFLANTPGFGFNGDFVGEKEWHSLWKYTYVSGDGSGEDGTWEDRSANLPAFGGSVGDFVSQNSYDLMIKVHPDNTDTVFIGGTNLYRSTDGFITSTNTKWIGGYAPINDISLFENHHPDQHAMFFYSSTPAMMLSSHDGGISKTNDALADSVKWQSLNNGYMTTQFYTIAIDHGTPGNEVIIGGMQDNGTWFTNTSTMSPWVSVRGGDGAFAAIADGRTAYYVSSQNGDIQLRILDEDGNLLQWTRIDPEGGSDYLFINPFILDPNNNEMMYLAGGDHLWRNHNLTEIPLFSNDRPTVNWTELVNSTITEATITALDVSKSPANRLYYGSNNGKVFRIDDAQEGDPVPTDVWSGKGFPEDAYVSCITVDPKDANNVLVAFSNYRVQSLFFSADSGSNWTHVSGNLEQFPDGSGNGPSIRWAEILHVGETTIYFVATSTGLYSTSGLDGDATLWVQEGASVIGNVVVDMMDSRSSDGLVVAATHGAGVFSANFISTSVVQNNNSAPNNFTLSQNYPNPFNPSTEIKYEIPFVSQVNLTLFNSKGQLIGELIDEELSAGFHSITWDGLDGQGNRVGSGVYFYRLEARSSGSKPFTSTMKMLLLK